MKRRTSRPRSRTSNIDIVRGARDRRPAPIPRLAPAPSRLRERLAPLRLTDGH